MNPRLPPPSRRRTATLVAAGVLLIAACGDSKQSDDGAATAPTTPELTVVTKSGPASVSPVELTLVLDGPPDRPGGRIAQHFVDNVAELSNGLVTIEPTFESVTGKPGPWGEQTIDEMKTGTVDLSLLTPGQWESAGVAEMRPLQLPGIAVNDQQLDAIASSDVAGEILDGLDGTGVVGLGLYPQTLRHLSMYDEAPLTLDSLQGARLRIGSLPTLVQWLEVIGADPVDLSFPDYQAQVADGSLAGADLSLYTSNIAPLGPVPAAISVNVPIYPQFSVLALSEKTASKLDDATQEILRQAADHTLDEVIANRSRQADLAETACAQGMVLLKADDGVLDDIVEAAQPVIDEVAADPVAGPILTAVRAAAGSGSVDDLPACVGGAEADAASLTPTAGDLPNGIYRGEVTPEMIAAVELPEQDCLYNCGVYTTTLVDGHYSWTVDWPVYPPAEIKEGQCCWQAQEGTYEVDGDRIRIEIPFLWDTEPTLVLEMRWLVNDDGSVRFEYVDGGGEWAKTLRAGWAEPVWTRIGDA